MVVEQFPDFFKEEGRDFMQFVKHYYEYLEQDNNALNRSRNLEEYSDIDETIDDFVQYFMKKYMSNVPTDVLGDRRFLEKHILDMYRSKGSIEGMKLLFRLLYNEEINVYIPTFDVLRTSDGKWIAREYLEIQESRINPLYQGELITGASSGATAFVESYERKNINDRPIHILYLSNIKGSFVNDELITSVSVSSDEGTKISGSPVSVTPLETYINNSIGDEFVATNGTGVGLKVLVSGLEDLAGTIEFDLQPGNYGYANDSIITITSGANTSGSGAMFEIGEIANTVSFEYCNVVCGEYASVVIGATNYANTANDVSDMSTANAISPIYAGVPILDKLIGEIRSLRVTNVGQDYDGGVTVTIVDPNTSKKFIIDEDNGGYWGLNANVQSYAGYGDNAIKSLKIKDSGLGYTANGETLTFVNVTDNTVTMTANVYIGALGKEAGRWENNRGFLNSDKYIHDSYFYQEYSYQIRSSKSLDKYIRVLKSVMHPTGNEVFGRVVMTSTGSDSLRILSSTITQS